MASWSDFRFDKATDVLRPRARRGQQVSWVLLPVFAWRVVAPVPKPRKLNVFQRAVLALARAGVVQVDVVAERLRLHRDLVALVVQELQTRMLMDVLGRPTKHGVDALAEADQLAADELRTGHILTHASDGSIWPCFLIGDLPLAEVEPDEDGWPVMLSGSVGDPWRDRAFAALPRGPVCATAPRPLDIVRAAGTHRKRRSSSEDDAEATSPVDKVSFVDRLPSPFLVAVAARPAEAGGWCVEDPFDRGPSEQLFDRVEKLLDEQPGLRRWLDQLVGGEKEGAKADELHVRAAWEIEERLTLAIRRHEVLHRRLVAMQRALLEAEQQNAPDDKWDDVLVKAQKAGERLLQDVHATHNRVGPPLFEELDRNVRPSRRKVDAAAKKIGFPTPLPQRLSSVRRGKVQHAEQSGRGSLRPLLILVLLAAQWDDEHPLRAAATRRPSLLVDLDALAAARDDAAHEGAEPWPAQVKRNIESFLGTVEALLLNSSESEGANHG